MIDPSHVGRRYGPYRYTVGVEAIRDFAVTIAGGVPGRAPWAGAAEAPHPWFVDEEAARASPAGGLVAPPTFVVRFAIEPFAAACADPALGIDLVKLLHGEQAFEYGVPVRPGDVLETTGEIVLIQAKAGKDFLTVKTTTTDARGRMVVVGTWTAVVLP
jgi:acyl dehydratase